jgi:hypothetical protein
MLLSSVQRPRMPRVHRDLHAMTTGYTRAESSVQGTQRVRTEDWALPSSQRMAHS